MCLLNWQWLGLLGLARWEGSHCRGCNPSVDSQPSSPALYLLHLCCFVCAAALERARLVRFGLSSRVGGRHRLGSRGSEAESQPLDFAIERRANWNRQTAADRSYPPAKTLNKGKHTFTATPSHAVGPDADLCASVVFSQPPLPSGATPPPRPQLRLPINPSPLSPHHTSTTQLTHHGCQPREHRPAAG